MSFAVFGPGACFITRTDIAVQTTLNVGFAQEMSLDVSATTKQLFGQNQYPLDAARATAKTTGKIKAALVSGLALNAAFFGQSFAAGSLLVSLGEGPTAIPTTPFQITVAQSATWESDLGVISQTAGLAGGVGTPLIKVASAPATGQYSVAAGIYTFNTADSTKSVTISYSYTNAATGQKMTLANTLIGTNPTFQLDYVTTRNAKTYYIRVFQAIASKFMQTFKLEDYMIPELDFEFFANSAGNIWTSYYPDIS